VLAAALRQRLTLAAALDTPASSETEDEERGSGSSRRAPDGISVARALTISDARRACGSACATPPAGDASDSGRSTPRRRRPLPSLVPQPLPQPPSRLSAAAAAAPAAAPALSSSRASAAPLPSPGDVLASGLRTMQLSARARAPGGAEPAAASLAATAAGGRRRPAPLGAGAFGSNGGASASSGGERLRSPSLGPWAPPEADAQQKSAAAISAAPGEAAREKAMRRQRGSAEDPVEAVARTLASRSRPPSPSAAAETAAALADARRHLHSLLGGVCTLRDPGPLPPRAPPPAGDIRAKPPKVVASSATAPPPPPPPAAASPSSDGAATTTPTTVRAEGLLGDLRRLRAAGNALAAEAEAKKCFGVASGGGCGDSGCFGPQRPASPAALPSRPSSAESLGGVAAFEKKKQQQENKKDPAAEQYLDELSRLRAEAEKAFSVSGGERERAAAA
jgi:hypothetical protein